MIGIFFGKMHLSLILETYDGLCRYDFISSSNFPQTRLISEMTLRTYRCRSSNIRRASRSRTADRGEHDSMDRRGIFNSSIQRASFRNRADLEFGLRSPIRTSDDNLIFRSRTRDMVEPYPSIDQAASSNVCARAQ